ncbi:MAG: hypothetical protein IT251_08450 [Chitinophagaceae bacterium]|nr:hypothetical protein [Chitinophagaceae bacterium]
MKKFFYTLIFLCIANISFANFVSPGTGVKWNLDSLVAHSAGIVTFNGAEYIVNDTVFIVTNDTLSITTDAVVKYYPLTYLDVNGVLLINPPNNVKFTAINSEAGFNGMRIDSSNATVLKKLTFEYAVSLKTTDCNITIDSCTFQFNNVGSSTSFGNGALSLFRASPTITHSQFLNNRRAAIQGGANIANAPQIFNNIFYGNGSMNVNVPHINIGATGSDTLRIINNEIIGVPAAIQTGAIGFLPIGSANTIIAGNIIKHNRYGITTNGGSNIYALIKYNIIDSNNIQNNPNLGGSGIAFSGGSATSHQNAIVTGNLIRGNLWGITIQGRSKPNIGNVENVDTTDDGKNVFLQNNNVNTPWTDLYNNTVDSIYAQGNYWGTNIEDTVESRIFHQVDNASLGIVLYSNFILPIRLSSFSISKNNNIFYLNWKTAEELNSDYFEVERSYDGKTFEFVGSVIAKGFASGYSFMDDSKPNVNSSIYYRLKMVDKDGSFMYSKILIIKPAGIKTVENLRIYPSIISSGNNVIWAEFISTKEQPITIQYYTVEGKIVTQLTQNAFKGNNKIIITPNVVLNNGVNYIKVVTEGFEKVIPIVKYN